MTADSPSGRFQKSIENGLGVKVASVRAIVVYGVVPLREDALHEEERRAAQIGVANVAGGCEIDGHIIMKTSEAVFPALT